jgi:peptidoglycan/LPS O-acetylase OafA/YrhL
VKKEFYTQLDGLRALAIIAVLIAHWLPLELLQKKLACGFWGVNLFFVLSGFLITESLMKQIQSNSTPKKILRSFFIRRSLRIFPIYYLLIFVAYALNLDGSRDFVQYTLTYTLNFYDAFTGAPEHYLTHLWSLCVEEQFYLVWPFLLLFIPTRHHKGLIFTVILLSLVLRFALALIHYPNFQVYNYRMMPACLDALGLGALLAHLKLFALPTLQKLAKMVWVPLLCVTAFGIIQFIDTPFHDLVEETLSRFVVSICCFFIVASAVFGYSNKFGRLLELPFMRYIGKISYGIYLYHLVISALFAHYFNNYLFIHFPPYFPQVLKYNLYVVDFPLVFVITFLVSSLSYYLVERPFLQLKDRLFTA